MTLDFTDDETLALAHLLQRTIVSRRRLAMPMCSRGRTCAAGIIGEDAADAPRLAVGRLIGPDREALRDAPAAPNCHRLCAAEPPPRLRSIIPAPRLAPQRGSAPREDHDVD
jgi:hypothetical protein